LVASEIAMIRKVLILVGLLQDPSSGTRNAQRPREFFPPGKRLSCCNFNGMLVCAGVLDARMAACAKARMGNVNWRCMP